MMANKAPRFDVLYGADLDRKDNAVTLIFEAQNRTHYEIKISAPIVGNVVTALMWQHAKLPKPTSGELEVQPFTCTGARAGMIEKGPVLFLQFEGKMDLSILVSKEAIAGLQRVLDELRALAESRDPKRQH